MLCVFHLKIPKPFSGLDYARTLYLSVYCTPHCRSSAEQTPFSNSLSFPSRASPTSGFPFLLENQGSWVTPSPSSFSTIQPAAKSCARCCCSTIWIFASLQSVAPPPTSAHATGISHLNPVLVSHPSNLFSKLQTEGFPKRGRCD